MRHRTDDRTLRYKALSDETRIRPTDHREWRGQAVRTDDRPQVAIDFTAFGPSVLFGSLTIRRIHRPATRKHNGIRPR